MAEHEVCKDCRWNNYPICNGIKMEDDTLMNIENLRPLYSCVIKFQEEGMGFIKNKSEYELKIKEIEDRISVLENK